MVSDGVTPMWRTRATPAVRMGEAIVAQVGIYGAAFVIGLISSAIPTVLAEVFLASYVAYAGGLDRALVLALLVSIGQMIVKVPMYEAARGATKLTHPKPDGRLARAKARIEKWKDKPFALTFVSAVFGLPPFYLLVLLAGILEMRRRTFLAVGLAGRVIHFVGIALIALYAS
jgi:membrane protein YqaA with SNARE-associated domain